MNPDVKAKAQALAEAIKASDELKKLDEARATIDEHESAKIMLRDLARLQEELQRKQLSGQQLTEADVQRFQELSVVAGSNPYVRKLLEAERTFSEMMMVVQELLSEALGQDQGGEEEAAPEAEQPAEPKQAPPAKSRLWTPRG